MCANNWDWAGGGRGTRDGASLRTNAVSFRLFPDDFWQVSEAMKEESDRLGLERAAVIRASMGLLWKGYAEHAWGQDEVSYNERKMVRNDGSAFKCFMLGE